MKTRIKIVERNDGHKTFVVQNKYGVDDQTTMQCLAIPIIGWTVLIVMLFKWDDFTEHSSESEAKRYIDELQSLIKSNQEKEYSRKIKSTTYLKYP